VCRKIVLKGLYGEQSRITDFINTFREEIHSSIAQLPEDKRLKPKTVVPLGLKKPSKNIRRNNHDSDSEDEHSGKSVSFNETSSIYQIHKILTSD
jgi:hypothetical protein